MEILNAVIVIVALLSWPTVTAIIAQSFGRKFITWFCLALVLPVVSLMILHCLPAKRKRPACDEKLINKGSILIHS